MRHALALMLVLLLGSCQTAPELVAGKGAVFGTVETRAHKDFMEKFMSGLTRYRGAGGKVEYTDEMVNYDALDEVYAGLIDSGRTTATVHDLEIGANGMSLRSLAIAVGDVLRIRNASSRPLTFFAVDLESEDDFLEMPVLAPGETGEMTVTLSGDLEMSTDEDEAIRLALLSRPGLVARRISSGASYSFERLEPGAYGLIFWYWRLGHLEHEVTVLSGQNVQVNETLSVDRIIK